MPSSTVVIGLASQLAGVGNHAEFCERFFSPLAATSRHLPFTDSLVPPLETVLAALQDAAISAQDLAESRNAMFVHSGGVVDENVKCQLIADCASELCLDFAPVFCESTSILLQRAMESIECDAVDLALVILTDGKSSVALVLTSEAISSRENYRNYCALNLSPYPEQSSEKLSLDKYGLVLSATNQQSRLRALGPSRAPSGTYFADCVPLAPAVFGNAQASQDLLELFALNCACLSMFLRVLPRVHQDNSHAMSQTKPPQPQNLPPGVISYQLARPWIHPALPEQVKEDPRQAMVLADHQLFSLRELSSDLSESRGRPNLRQSSELFFFEADNSHELLLKLQALSFESNCDLGQLACEHYLIERRSRSAHIDRASKTRLAIVASSAEELRSILNEAFLQISSNPNQAIPFGRRATGFTYSVVGPESLGSAANKVAFLFPGLGASYPNMLADLCFYFPEVRGVFDFVERLAVRTNDKVLPSRAIFPLTNNGSQSISQALLATIDSAVVTLLLAQWALFHILAKVGIHPHAFLGCSTGEFAVLAMNSCFDIFKSAEPFYRLSTNVSRSVEKEELLKLRTIRVTAPFAGAVESITRSLAAPVYLGAEMSNTCSLISGERSVMDSLCAELKKQEIDYLVLPVAIPYHTPLVAGKIDRKDQELLRLDVKTPDRESWSASLGETYPNDPKAIFKLTMDLFEKPIQFRSTVEKMYDAGTRVFLEVAPKGSLIPYVSEILKGKPHRALACNLAERSGIDQLNIVLATLYCDGLDMELEPLYERRRQSGQFLSPAGDEPEYPTEQEFADASSEVLLSYFRNVNEMHSSMVDMQSRLMQAYLLTAPEESAASKKPFLTQSNISYAEASVQVLLPLSTTAYPFIRDHAIGGNLSALNDNSRVYLLPLMVAIEIMAEVAGLLFPDAIPVKLMDIRALKRIRVSEKVSLLKVEAQQLEDGLASVTIYDAEQGNVLASCQVKFQAEYDLAPEPTSFSKSGLQASKFSPTRLYHKGSMFHGPAMQAVQCIDAVFQKTIEGKLCAATYANWFAEHQNSELGFMIDPLILDNLSQFVLYQMYEHDLNASALLPFHIASIDLYDDLDRWRGQQLDGVVHLRSMSKRGTLAVMELKSPDGRLLLHVEEISSRAIMLDEKVRDIVFEPAKVFSSEWNCFGNSQDSVMTVLRTTEFPDEETVLDWLTDYVLSADEQPYWQALGKNEKRRKQWLMGRIAAKDAVRSYVLRKHGVSLRMLDLQLEVSESGAAGISAIGFNNLSMPQISISHCETIVCAIAEERIAGIDVEELKVRDEGFEKLAFTASEKLFLDRLSDHRDYICWSTAFWTAKEASAKAHSTGFMGNPKLFEAVAMNKDEGMVTVRAPRSGAFSREYSCSVRFDFDNNVAVARVNGYKDC